MKKVSLVSLGCSKNLVDAEQMTGLLEEAGYEVVLDEEDGDIMIVNTCAFIEAAKQESIECIFELASYKKDNPDRILIVTGCMAQRYKDEVLTEIPEVDAVIGTNDFQNIVEIIKEAEAKRGICRCDGEEIICEGLPRSLSTPKYTAYLKIAEGCDNRCTYCAIPYIRGKYRSRRMEDIVAEAKALAETGVKELIVIAQDTTRYGIDLYNAYKLPALLEELCKIEGLLWIRLHYLYPELITDELIDVIASEEKIVNYMDIPIQHANDRILKLMGRRTNKAQIESLIQKLRERIPGVTIRTSLIAGFPSETEEEFSELYDFVEKTRFDRLGVFAYSMEEGTPAAKLSGQIDNGKKLDRQDEIMLLQEGISEELSEEKIETVQTVLVEGFDEIIKSHYGRTYADSVEIDGKVFFKAKRRIPEGEMVKVKIEQAMAFDLFGTEYKEN
ncbi:MAG: 30S ribosomal protein S12 methylthiotransferase RimO [Clostridia bacterium]|nr:30S ribosomal protein S12 methylthiotransferase RimO [Clostridia bacterium]